MIFLFQKLFIKYLTSLNNQICMVICNYNMKPIEFKINDLLFLKLLLSILKWMIYIKLSFNITLFIFLLLKDFCT